MNKFFKNLKDKVDSFYSTEGTDLDKDIFINSDQRLLKIASSIIVLTSFLGIGWLAIAETDEIIIVPGKIIPIGKVKEIKIPIQGGLDPKILLTDKEILKKEVEKYLHIFKDHPYIFNLGHGILPETKIEMVEDLIKIVRNFK